MSDAQGTGQLGRMQGAGSAEADEHEIPGIVSPFHGDHAQSALHVRMRDLEHPEGGHFGRAEFSGALQLRLPGKAFEHVQSSPGIERVSSPEKPFPGQTSQHEMGVGDRGCLTPLAVAGRPGIGPGAPGADPQSASGIDGGD
jgi:hypothetical protein